MDNLQRGTVFAFRDPTFRVSMAVVTEYAAALMWAVGLLAYASAGAFMSPAALIFLTPAVVVTIAAWTVRRRAKFPAKHRSGPAHAL
ncbi:hypothetical protein DQ354_19330 [Arthrobacter sp. AQ5-06]|nr:hypothetical protein DQ354_19330 [Arthrobacter sp. AQ5-06]